MIDTFLLAVDVQTKQNKHQPQINIAMKSSLYFFLSSSILKEFYLILLMLTRSSILVTDGTK